MSEIKFDSFTTYLNAFSTEEGCLNYLEELRWKDGVRCPFCMGKSPYEFKDSNTYKCSDNRCNKKFNVKTNTIFQGTKISLVKWFLAIYLQTTHKKGVSSYQMGRDLGISQKSVWKMLHKIRKLYDVKADQLQGIVEVDETFVGGKNRNRHRDKKVKYSRGRSFKDKTPVVGMLERGTKRVITRVVSNTSAESLEPVILDHVVPESILMTDEWWGYRDMNKYYEHYKVDHGKGMYGDGGDIHTNTIEGFWSHLKRGLKGIYHHVSPKYLQAYCNEYAFRYNVKHLSEEMKVKEVLKQVCYVYPVS